MIAVTIGCGSLFGALASLAAARVQQMTGLPVRVLADAEARAAGVVHPVWLKAHLFRFVEAECVLYFNAGLFLAHRSHTPWLQEAQRLGGASGTYRRFGDQSALNEVFHGAGAVRLLPRPYNHLVWPYEAEAGSTEALRRLDALVAHFVCGSKEALLERFGRLAGQWRRHRTKVRGQKSQKGEGRSQKGEGNPSFVVGRRVIGG